MSIAATPCSLDCQTPPATNAALTGFDSAMACCQTQNRILPTDSGADFIRLRYTFDGQIAERIDARGVAFRYRYDDAGRLASIEVGSYVLPKDSGVLFIPGYPSWMTTSLGAPVDRIGFVEYSYDNAGRLSGVITRDRRLTTGSNPQPGRVITQNTFDYNTHSDLLREWQSLGELVGTNTPKVEYAWEYAPSATDLGATPAATGRHRLTSIHYPQHQSVGGGRTVSFGYGDANSVDELLSRLTYMDTAGAPKLAQFTYSGVARRQQLKYAQGSVTQSLLESGQTGLARLDGLGRIADLKFANSAGTVLFESKYTFDSSGNRRSAQVTQAPVGGVVNQNRSVVNTYDGFQRLTGSEMGQLDLSNPTSPSIVTSTSVRSDVWNLDLLGNWVGGVESGQPVNTPGRRTFGDLDHLAAPWYPVASDATPDEITQVMAVNFQNSVYRVNETRDFDSAPRQLLPRYDAAGSMTFDGEYFYQYDAWNRVVQINRASLASPANPDSAIVFGPMVKHYTYDGVGRLVRTQSPWPNPDLGGDNVRTERFFYDGIRRIQELVTDPVQNLSAAAMSSSASVQQAAATAVAVSSEELDASAAPASVEAAQAAESTPINVTTLAREYVWGPGDNGIDELFAQFDESSKPWWIIQDTGGDIVAVVEVPNANAAPSSTNLARVAAQWTYDAYGSVVSAEHLFPHPLMHCGHKGMFFDRLDVGVIDLVSNSELPRLIPFSHAVYHNRNRLYNPQFGRFMQQDPNATAMALLDGSHSGRGAGAVALAFSTEERFGDGYNLYQYLASNPSNRSDPMGLSWDSFEMVDSYLSENAGSTAAFMERIGSGAQVAGYVGAVFLSTLPFPITSFAGDIGADILEGKMPPELVTARKVLGYIALAGASVFVAKTAYSAGVAAVKYVMTHGFRGTARNLLSGGAGLAKRAWGWLSTRKPKGTPGTCSLCFTGSTVVWTITGLVPIADIQPGDLVLSQDEATCEVSFQPVLEKFTIFGAAITELQVLYQNGRIETVETTDEHPFWTEERGWRRVDELKPGDTLRTKDGLAWVAAIRFGIARTEVYNFTVEHNSNYFVESSGIWVHNCPANAMERGAWVLTEDGARQVKRHPRFGKFYESSATPGEWWSVDNAEHGGSAFKVFREEGNKLNWIYDADAFGDFIRGEVKHKGPVGLIIPLKELH